ncbi:MAG TPA: hypothetical protein PLU87_00170 [Sedimentisphaerales bacterium]|nr:hypothetical protein [Sedimentisphaerales bacterium]HRS09708.1 hypothetical protein [Sedimentisphaerales bacterium]HRV46389.1 hypothetical protein [Sedimentisphaerales bacterium]
MDKRELLTSTQLAARHGLDRDRMEFLLHELGLRHEADDGTTTYDASEVERRFAARDEALMRAAAELLDFVPDIRTAVEILHRAFFELRLAWLQSRAAGDVIDILRRQIATRLPSLHAIQRARAGAGDVTELEVLRCFEHAIITGLRERRGQRPPGRTKQGAKS